MKHFKTLIILLVILISCKPSTKKEIAINSESKKYDSIGVQYLLVSKRDSALVNFNKAIDIDHNNYNTYRNRMQLYAMDKDFSNAIKDGKYLLALKPEFAEMHFFLGMVYDKTDNITEAKKSYQKSIEIYNKRILDENNHDKLFANKLNRVLSLLFLEKKKEAKKEFTDLESVASDQEKQLINIFSQRTKEDFLNDFFQ